MTLIVQTLLVCEELGTNGYLISAGGADTVLIDPGTDSGVVETALTAVPGRRLAAVWVTHGHFDHMGATRHLKEIFPDAVVVCGDGEQEHFRRGILNMSTFFGNTMTADPPDKTVRDGDMLESAGLRAKCIVVPGHSPASVCYYIARDDKPDVLFSGDVLFAGSIGRTDFPGGDHEALITGIRGKLFRLPPDTIVYPGHGPATTIRREMETSPFF